MKKLLRLLCYIGIHKYDLILEPPKLDDIYKDGVYQFTNGEVNVIFLEKCRRCGKSKNVVNGAVYCKERDEENEEETTERQRP
jgi:hypothetical protein